MAVCDDNSTETEIHDVRLFKDDTGLGITVAGYVCNEEDISGIFVKEINKGSVADVTGNIQINDRIVKVDGVSVTALKNYQAIEILKNSGPTVVISVERYLKNRQHETLQQSKSSLQMIVSSTNESRKHDLLHLGREVLQTLPEVAEKDKSPVPERSNVNISHDNSHQIEECTNRQVTIDDAKDNNMKKGYLSSNMPTTVSDESDFDLSYKSISNEDFKTNQTKDELIVVAKKHERTHSKSDNSLRSESSCPYFSKISDDNTEKDGYETCIDESLSDDICAKNHQVQISSCKNETEYDLLCAINNNACDNYASNPYPFLESNIISGISSEPCLLNNEDTVKWNSDRNNSNLKSYSSAETDEFFLVQCLDEEEISEIETKCLSEPYVCNLLQRKTTFPTFRRLKLKEYYNDYEDCLDEYRCYIEEDIRTTETKKEDENNYFDGQNQSHQVIVQGDNNDITLYIHENLPPFRSNSAPDILEYFYRMDICEITTNTNKNDRRLSCLPSPRTVCNWISNEDDMTVTSKQQYLCSEENSEDRTMLESNWGSCKTIHVCRDSQESLGISIVCGKVDLYNSNTSLGVLSGIFVKNITPNSVADKTGQFHVGDRILEVDGIDLRGATHEEAVEAIRNAKSPISFVIQSLISLKADNTDHEQSPEKSAPLVQSETLHQNEQINNVTEKNVPYSEQKIEVSKEIDKTDEKTSENKFNQIESISQPTNTKVIEVDKKEGKTKFNQVEKVEKRVEEEESSEDETTETEQEDEFGYTTDKIKKKYANLGNTIMMVQLERGQQGLGLSLAGHKDRNCMAVFVCGLNPNGAAYKAGGIQVGDEILEVNGIVLHGRCHLNASAIIKGLAGPTFKILILRRKTAINDIAVRPVTHFPVAFDEQISQDKFDNYPNVRSVILQKGNRSLGIMIIEGKHAELGQGIFISDIQLSSAAEKAGLEIGEMILAVNQDSLLGANYDIAANILKRTEGVVTLMLSNPIRKSNSPFPEITNQETKLPVILKTSGPSSRAATPIPESIIDPLTCNILLGRNTTIEINTDNRGLGIFFVGGKDTLISSGIVILEIFPGGAAHKDGRLKPGDQILDVNGTCLKEATSETALQTLRQILPKMKLIVFRPDKIEYDIIEVELMKKPGKGLGLSIIGMHCGKGVYISEILNGGNADIDGRIIRGDLLVSVNGQNVENGTPVEVGSILKTLVGKAVFKFHRFKPVLR